MTGTAPISPDESEAKFEEWLPTLERALFDPLGGLVSSYEKAVRSNNESTIENLEVLIADLREASKLRNVICHGSWRPADEHGFSIPFFVTRDMQIFETPIDVSYFQQLQRHVTELIATVIDTVTAMGWQFPGSNGPGNPIWNR